MRYLLVSALSFWVGLFAACAIGEPKQASTDSEPGGGMNEPVDTDVGGDTQRPTDEPKTQPGDCDALPPEFTFCDGFDGDTLNTERWWYGRKHWGPDPPDNHGVAPENVQVAEGMVAFTGNGDHYDGDIYGVRKETGAYIQDQPGSRSGGVIVSDTYFGSGQFEVRMKLPAQTGVCSAVWTFHYQEIYEGQPGYEDYVAAGYHVHGNANLGHWVIANHEIDIELPTALQGEATELASYRNARYNTWIGERYSEFTEAIIDHGVALNDGEFHVWRVDWHTGGDGEEPRVEFFVDDVLVHTSTTHIPDIASRLTMGTWFPSWAGGVADFESEVLLVDWIRYRPFHEPNDRFVDETYPNDGMTKCHDKASNDAALVECRISTF